MTSVQGLLGKFGQKIGGGKKVSAISKSAYSGGGEHGEALARTMTAVRTSSENKI